MKMYTLENMTNLTPAQMHYLLKATHQALAALLWLIEDARNFEPTFVESHFDETIPMDRAEEIHRMLVVYGEELHRLADRGYLSGDHRRAFLDWASRCSVADSFPGTDELFNL